jgi:hypothetical protein
VKKNRLKLKKKTNRFGFDFINLKPKKLNRTKPKLEKKPSQTEKTEQIDLNRFCSKKPNRTETSQFKPVLAFLKKNRFNYFFFLIKTKANQI